MTILSVNLNKIALLRNARGGSEPNLLGAARAVIEAGASGITVHPRPDARHTRADDVFAIAALLRGEYPHIELNIEGNPFAPPRAGYPGLQEMVRAARPSQCTLVPDDDAQLTSDHGFDLARDAAKLAPLVETLRASGARVSVFVDPVDGARLVSGMRAALDIGVERVEIYTGPYAEAFLRGDCARVLGVCLGTARAAQSAGLGVNAGHDLDQRNLQTFLAGVPGVLEVSIGHALIAEALYAGLAPTVHAYLAAIEAASTQ